MNKIKQDKNKIGYFSQSCLDPIDLNTKAKMYGLNVSNCTVRHKNFIKVKKEKLPTSLFCVTPNHYEPKRK